MSNYEVSARKSAMSQYGMPPGVLDNFFSMAPANDNQPSSGDAEIVSMGYRLSSLIGVERTLTLDDDAASEVFVSLRKDVAASIGDLVSNMVKFQPSTPDGHKLKAYAVRYAKRHGIA